MTRSRINKAVRKAPAAAAIAVDDQKPDLTPDERIAQLEAQLRKIQRSQLLGQHNDFDDQELADAVAIANAQFARHGEFPHDDKAETGAVQCVQCRTLWHTDVDGPAWGRSAETVGYGPSSRCVALVPALGAPLPRNEQGEVIRQVPMQVCGGQLQYVEETSLVGFAAAGTPAPRRLSQIPRFMGRVGA